ncbi:helix-turn-helix transcriptional regulator [Peribacillus simplex]|uniref:helix-turn-helix transcriptional regulator n=1 Tax=Peribacillus simplex TaxID=1478 RepID=UPI0011AABAAD|nr:helix-turn-helix transcriptional regulator [Peribacillus simplex]
MLKPRIRVLLAEKDLKQNEICKELEVSATQFSNWVNGTSFPRLELAFKLAKILDCKIEELWIEDQ